MKTTKNLAQITSATFVSEMGVSMLPTFTWGGTVGVRRLDATRNVRVEISDAGHVGHYSRILLSIVNRQTGAIDKMEISFDEIFSGAARSDKRTDWPTGGQTTFYLWANRGSVGWYIAIPASYDAIRLAVEKYIEVWS